MQNYGCHSIGKEKRNESSCQKLQGLFENELPQMGPWLITLDRRQTKMLILLTKVDKKSLETEFSIAFYHQTGDKWQSKTLFLAISDLCSSIVKRGFDNSLSGVLMLYQYC